MPDRAATPPPHLSQRSPLWAVLAVAFLASIGTGVVTNGIYFISQHGYGFTTAQNYWLGLVLGSTYVVGSLAAGPVLRWLAASRSVATRSALGVTFAFLGLLCGVPIAFRGEAGVWPIWALVVLYSPLTGIVWPIVEAYVSGGRRGQTLRSAIGRFNYVWAGAIVVAYWTISPAVKEGPAIVIALLGVLHLGTIGLLAWWKPEPGRHLEEHHEPHPTSYRQLLVTFRILLPTSYVVLTALLPYLPGALSRLGVRVEYHALLAAIWLGARVVVFVVLERWHGWHGRWYPAVVGGVLMVAGFGVSILAPTLPLSVEGCLGALLAGLGAFGAGMAVVYCGALYYAMEVGNAEVDAGGRHEALIGVGYSAGPMLGLLALQGVSMGWISERWFEASLLGAVGIVAAGAAAIAAWRSWRAGQDFPAGA